MITNNLKRKAFTLVELLIVIAIIGILFIVLISKVDFATDKAKATGVQTDFRSFQVAIESVAKEHAGLATFGWDTGDINGDRIRNSYDKGDINKNGKQDEGEVFIGSKIYTETWTGIYTLTNPVDANDGSAITALESAINNNLDPKLHITMHDDLTITMANGAQDPWDTEYHGFYITNATVDGKDRGAIVIYSNGANQEWGSEHSISNGVVVVNVPGNNVYGKDDYSLAVAYTYANGYGEVKTSTTGFSQNQGGGPSNNVGTQPPSENIDYEKVNGIYLLDINNYQFVNTENRTCTESLGTVYPFGNRDDVPEQYKIVTYGDSALAYYNAKINDIDVIYGQCVALEIDNDNVYYCIGSYFRQYDAFVVCTRSYFGSLSEMLNGQSLYCGGCEHGDLYSKIQIVLSDNTMTMNETLVLPEGCTGNNETLSQVFKKQNNVSIYDNNDFSEFYLFTSMESCIGGLDETGFVFDMEIYDLKFSSTSGSINVGFYYENIGKTYSDFFNHLLLEFSDHEEMLLNSEYFNTTFSAGNSDILNELNIVVGWNGYYLNFPWNYALQTIGLIPADFVDDSDLISVQKYHEFDNNNALFTNTSNIQFILNENDTHSRVASMFINNIPCTFEEINYRTYGLPSDIAFKFDNAVNNIKFVLNDGTIIVGQFRFELEDRVLNNNATFTSNNVSFIIKSFESECGNIDYVVLNDGVLGSYGYSLTSQGNGNVVFNIEKTVINSLTNKETHTLTIYLNDGTAINIEFVMDIYSCLYGVNHNYLEPGLYTSSGQLIVDWNTLLDAGLDVETDITTKIEAVANTLNVPDVKMYSVLQNFVPDGEHVILSLGNVSRIGKNVFYGFGSNGSMLNSTLQLVVSSYFGNIVIDQLIIPNSVTEFGESCFESSMINNIIFNGTDSEWNNISLGKKWNKNWSGNNIAHTTNNDVAIDAYIIPGPSDPTNYLAPGLYAMDGTLALSWNQLVSAPYNFNISATYTSSNYLTSTTSLHYILTNYDFGVDLSEGFILSVDNSVSTIGAYALYIMDSNNNLSYNGPTLRTLIINNKSTSFKGYALGKTIWLETFMYNGTSAEWDSNVTKTNYWYGSSTSTKFTIYCTDGEYQKNGCITGDTLILMADGSYKRIDELTYDDVVMVWNFETGTYDIAPIAIIFYHGHQEWDVVNLKFSDGTTLNIINSHGLFSADENKYVYIDIDNVSDYIGTQFVKYDNCEYITVTLVEYTTTTEYTGSYCLQTVGNNNYIAGNMFSLTKPDIEGIYDYFEIGENMKYDEVKMQADIEKYGLFTYDDFVETGITYDQFIAFNGAYMKILIGRGIITWQDVLDTINNYIL